MLTLSHILAWYFGANVDPIDPSYKTYSVLHQRCACHIINLIVKCGLKRLTDYLNVFRVAINFLNSPNQRIGFLNASSVYSAPPSPWVCGTPTHGTRFMLLVSPN
jgi:hypothetical protein